MDANTTTTTTLGDTFPVELERVRKLLDVYKGLGPAGAFGAVMIAQVIGRAEATAATGDVAAMIRSYQELKGCD